LKKVVWWKKKKFKPGDETLCLYGKDEDKEFQIQPKGGDVHVTDQSMVHVVEINVTVATSNTISS